MRAHERAQFRCGRFRRLPNHCKCVFANERWAASQQVEENRAEAVDVGSWGEIGRHDLGLFRCEVAGGSERSQRLREIAVCFDRFCQTEIAHQRFAAVIEENVSRLKIAMENSAAMSVFDRARNLCHQLHTLARFVAKRRPRLAQAATGREFHAEKRETVLAFAHLVYRKNVRMIEAGCGVGFASEAHERVMRIGA